MANNNAIRDLEEQRSILRQRNKSVPVPMGVTFSGSAEKLLWNQITRARFIDDWRTIDLILVSKLVKLEIEIRKQQDLLDDEGMILDVGKAKLVENPRFRVIGQLQSRQLAIVRALALNTSVDSAAHTSKAKKAAKLNGALDEGDEDEGAASSLLASLKS